MAAVDIIMMDAEFAKSLSAQMFIAGALILNIINFVGDRIENIKFKSFSASLSTENEYNNKHSIQKKNKKKTNAEWPDGESEERPEPTPTPPRKK